MRIGLLSDAHGNPGSLAACLRQLKAFQVDSIYFLGDAVGYLPGEAEVLRILRATGVYCQKGNHEAMLLGEIPVSPSKDRVYRIGSALARLSTADRQFIASWPDHRVLEFAGKRILLVHGSPGNRFQGYVYPDSDLSMLAGLNYDAIFMGHTHYPFVVRLRELLLVNVGSCGLPRDQGDLLAFAVYDADTNSCEVYRLQVDSQKIIEFFGAEHMAEEVNQCLLRKSLTTPFGQTITDMEV